MITLRRDGITMEVATELQASVFIRNGYKVVEPEKAETTVDLPKEDPPAEKPKRRRTVRK